MRRRFSAGCVLHIYQRTISGFNLFYSVEDFLVFYTIISVKSRIYNICLMGLCFMIDHLHMLVCPNSLVQTSRFISAATSLYVREFNSWTGRQGPLFVSAYGSAVKNEFKKIRSAIAYLFNNPVEKMQCRKAEEYRWNFLKYFNPERNKKHKGSPSKAVRRAIKIIDSHFNKNMYLKHALIHSLFKDMDSEEREYLTDYIITLYFPFDAAKTYGYYKSYKDMVCAINSNTGNEYDISELHYCKTDVPYREMMSCISKLDIPDIHKVITADEKEKRRLFAILKSRTSGTSVQIRKFLHINHPRNSLETISIPSSSKGI